MTRSDAYIILNKLIEEKIFSSRVECAIAMALDDMMIVAKSSLLKNGMQGTIDVIKDLKEERGKK